MPRMQVYLPDELYRRLKEHGWSPSEMLQQAVRAELRRRELAAATDDYLRTLVDEVGEPSEEDEAYAREFVQRLTDAEAVAERRAG